MKKLGYYSGLFLLIFFWSCKKEKKDTTSPSVTITAPQSGHAYNMFDTVFVAAHVSDETQLSSVVVTLVDANNIVLQYGYSVPIQGKDFSFNIQYYLTEFHLNSGTYYISVTARDGSNTTQRLIQIQITESPTTKSGYFVVGATQPKTIVRYDASFNQQNTISLNTGYNGMAFGPYYQQLFINGNINQSFVAYDVAMNGTAWSFPYNGGSAPTFMSVNTDGKKAFIGYYSGYEASATNAGQLSTGYSTGLSNYYPYHFAVTSSYGIGLYHDILGGSDRIAGFLRNTGVATNSTYLSFSAMAVFEYTTTQAYVFGNLNTGQAAYYLYDVPTNALSGPFVFPSGKLLAVTQVDPNYLLLALDDGKIYGYNCTAPLGGTYSALATVKAQKLVYNTKMRELNAAVKDQVYTYSLSTNYVLSFSGSTSVGDSIIGLEVITNK